jgi:hypothetical protein
VAVLAVALLRQVPSPTDEPDAAPEAPEALTEAGDATVSFASEPVDASADGVVVDLRPAVAPDPARHGAPRGR